MNKIALIQTLRRRVFTAQDLMIWWGYSDEQKLFELIKHYVRTGQIFRLARGLYSGEKLTQDDLRRDSNLLYEIANRMVPNSYVSLWTILKREGAIMQYYDEIYSIAKAGVIREVLGLKFVYKRVKEDVLFSDVGINLRDGIREATVERAIGDTLYLWPRYEIELLPEINRQKLMQVAKIYGHATLMTKLIKMGEERHAES